MSNNTIKQLTALGREFLDYSEELFGWQCTCVHKRESDYFLDTEYETEILYLYFARDSYHRAVDFGKEIKIAYHNQPTITFSVNTDMEELQKILKRYTELLSKIKKFHEKSFEEESKRNKEELKKALLEKLKSL